MVKLLKIPNMHREFRLNIIKNFDFLMHEIEAVQQRISEKIVSSSTVQEIIDARGGFHRLNDRLRHVEDQTTIPDNSIASSKLKTSANSDKIQLIHLSEEVKSAMTGNTSVSPDVGDRTITREKIALGGVSEEEMDDDLSASFEDISTVANEAVVEEGNLANQGLTSIFSVFSSMYTEEGNVFATENTSSTDEIGGGAFSPTLTKMSFKGMVGGTYILLGFDGEIAYHMSITQDKIYLRRHRNDSYLGVWQTFDVPYVPDSTRTITVERQDDTITIYDNEEVFYEILQTSTLAPMFDHFQLGFMQTPGNGFDNLTDVTLYQRTSQIPELKQDVNSLKTKVSALEETTGTTTDEVDLIMFMGQSNMGGRGTAAEAPEVPEGYAYEYRAVSDPTMLYPVEEPFGVNENRSGAITSATKTGSLVSAFAATYFPLIYRPLVGVSASKGGTSIDNWQPDGSLLPDAIQRFHDAESWLEANDYAIKNKIMVWCQGEQDGQDGTSISVYRTKLLTMIDAMKAEGIETAYIIRTGNHRDEPERYQDVIQAQTEACQMEEGVVLVSTKFDRMAEQGEMQDEYHYTQYAYNLIGRDAAINTTYHLNHEKEPTMYDWTNNTLYFSRKH